jgi:hypothetical protein
VKFRCECLATLCILLFTAAVVPALAAQAPVEERSPPPGNAAQQGQQRAGTAYRDLQRAEFDRRQAELDVQRAEGEYKVAQKRADELKRETENTRKVLEAAKAREAQARKLYDAAINAVAPSSPK